jgi:hypothetical protein
MEAAELLIAEVVERRTVEVVVAPAVEARTVIAEF